MRALAFRRTLIGPAIWLRLARIAARVMRHVSFRGTHVFLRHADVSEILDRDLDFRIEPINRKRIEEISGQFILGLDRKPTLEIERAILYSALRDVDYGRLHDAVRTEAETLIRVAGKSGRIDVVNGYARLVAARTAVALFGVTGPTEGDLVRAVRAVFHHTFLNGKDDRKVRDTALAAGKELRDWISAEVTLRRDGAGGPGGHVMDAMLRLSDDDDLVRRNIAGMLVGSIDTTATAVAQAAAMLLARPHLRPRLAAAVGNGEEMRGWCWEALRFWPQTPAVLRETKEPTRVGRIRVPAGSRVVALTLGAMHDRHVFPRPDLLDPTRPEGAYMHFGHGLHACAGRVVNRFQIPELIRGLVAADARPVGGVRFEGPFPNEFLVAIRVATP